MPTQTRSGKSEERILLLEKEIMKLKEKQKKDDDYSRRGLQRVLDETEKLNQYRCDDIIELDIKFSEKIEGMVEGIQKTVEVNSECVGSKFDRRYLIDFLLIVFLTWLGSGNHCSE